MHVLVQTRGRDNNSFNALYLILTIKSVYFLKKIFFLINDVMNMIFSCPPSISSAWILKSDPTPLLSISEYGYGQEIRKLQVLGYAFHNV